MSDDEVYDDEDASLFGGYTMGATTFFSGSGIAPILNPDEEKALCQKFEETLAEYDQDENYEDAYIPETTLDPIVEDQVLDDFLNERKDEIYCEGNNNKGVVKPGGGSSFAALVGTKMVHASELDHVDGQDFDDENEEELVVPTELEPSQEEVLIDGKSYFTERTVNPWDCESILSTYSNLDNNPYVIGSKSRRKKKKTPNNSKTMQSDVEQRPAQIILSSKTGLPLGVLPVTEKEYRDDNVVNKGVSRRGESKEEKRARKQAVKNERKNARLQKKVMKVAFAEELEKRTSTNDELSGAHTFRYS